MKTALLVVAFAVVASGCGARTAYTSDGKSWTCAPQARTVTFAGDPLALTEQKAKPAAVATTK